MKGELVIKKADIGHLKEIVAIFQEAIDEMDMNGIPQWDSIYPNDGILKEDILRGEMFLGEIDDKIASVVVINLQCDDEYRNGVWTSGDATFAVVHRLCVNPYFQNKGVGSKTMRIIEEILKNSGTKAIRLDAFSLNPFALRMYEKLGYIKVGDANFRKGLFYLYEKKIGQTTAPD